MEARCSIDAPENTLLFMMDCRVSMKMDSPISGEKNKAVLSHLCDCSQACISRVIVRVPGISQRQIRISVTLNLNA